MASPSIVIKVKYEETLRRFSALRKGDQHLQLNMEELRAKVCSLFNFPPDANFKLTYIDEDGDQVTLADNEDLHDVVIQDLNPLRVTVHLDSSDGAFSGTQSSGNSTLNRSSAQTSQNINPVVADVLESSKLSAELAFKAVSANPVVMDIVDNVLKMVHALQNSAHSCSDTATSTHEVRADDGMTCNGIGSTKPSSKSTQAPEVVVMSKETERVPSPIPPYFFFQKGKDTKTQFSAGMSVINTDVGLGAFNGKHEKDKVTVLKCLPNGLGPFKAHLEGRQDASRYYRDSKYSGTSSPSTFSSSNIGVPRVYRHNERRFGPVPFDNCCDPYGMGHIFHKGIRCDGCGVLPITGPRFKSKVKYDYDLCNICFKRMGSYSDYTRIDFPSSNTRMFKGFHDVAIPQFNPVQPLRLDSRFIKDVSVMDGTIMAPSTPFTKIWRMHNNGALPWSHGLQLLWIGGDRFSSSDSVEIQMPANGVDVGKEVDVAVDFTAPELPGQYLSYWRMAEPSGHKFGHRVWVLIQVDASLEHDDSTCESSASLYINQPLENTPDPNPIVKAETRTEDQNQKIDIGDLNLPINDDVTGVSEVSCAASTSSASSSVSPLVCTDNPVPPVSSQVSQSVVDDENSKPEQDEGKNEAENSKPEEQNEQKNVVEESLLKELEEMGFNQIDLNKDGLGGNEYDDYLEKSVDDICGVSEWDPILEELQEMGFHDKMMNKKLLEKNNGSIMRVVMDLVSGEEEA